MQSSNVKHSLDHEIDPRNLEKHPIEANNYVEMENMYTLEVYPKRQVVLSHGKGARVWDVTGKVYIDCSAGHGIASIGHCNDKVVAAIKSQAEKLITCSGTFYNDTRALLLKKLINISPKNLTKAYLCNSGTETIEAAIKFARYTTKKKEFICANRGFHGRTLGALSATYEPKYKEDFVPLVEGFHHVPFNDFDSLKTQINENTAGIILEIIQGEGGVHIGSKEYFHQVRQLCNEKNILLIIDEVQTGFCRTGAFFACNSYNLEPDIMCVAKAIAGGLPMGAVLCSNKITMDISKHGSTFGGNPLVCAAAIASIDFMIENNLSEQAKNKGEYLVRKLQKANLSVIREIRQLGLMVGIELKKRAKEYILALLDEGIIVLPAGTTVIRLLPPLVISYEELDIVSEKLIQVLGNMDENNNKS